MKLFKELITILIILTLATLLTLEHRALGLANQHGGRLEAQLEQEQLDHALTKRAKQAMLTALRAELNNLETDLVNTQKDLDLYYTMSKSGVKAITIEEIRALAQTLKTLPFGSPFRDGHYVTSSFGVRDERWFNGNGTHDGIDICPYGSWTILTTAPGQIIDFGEDSIFGKWIEYKTTTGYILKYAHLSKIFYQESTKVKNIPLTTGTKIGIMGNTGLTSGAHLHLEIKMPDTEGNYTLLDPEAILNYVGGQ